LNNNGTRTTSDPMPQKGNELHRVISRDQLKVDAQHWGARSHRVHRKGRAGGWPQNGRIVVPGPLAAET
jgi:hypothetical protein